MEITHWLSENKRVFFGEEVRPPKKAKARIETESEPEELDLMAHGKREVRDQSKSFSEEYLQPTSASVKPIMKSTDDKKMYSLEETSWGKNIQEKQVFEENQWLEEKNTAISTTSENLADEISGEMQRISWRYGHGMEDWTNDQPAF